MTRRVLLVTAIACACGVWHAAAQTGATRLPDSSGVAHWYAGQMDRAEVALKAAFNRPASTVIEGYNKRQWPMFLRSRGRLEEAADAARVLIADSDPVVQATGQMELGFALLAVNRWGDAGQASNAALRGLRNAPGGGIAAPALLALQGEFHLRTAAREKGRAALDDALARLRAVNDPALAAQALFTIDDIGRAARAVGDWEFAGRVARQLVEHDPGYAGGHYASGLVAEHDGDLAAMKQAFVRALDLWSTADGDLPEIREMRRKLR